MSADGTMARVPELMNSPAGMAKIITIADLIEYRRREKLVYGCRCQTAFQVWRFQGSGLSVLLDHKEHLALVMGGIRMNPYW